MKTDLKAKYLQTLLKKKKNQNAGFTLIELLVVIIIIGILAAIALPSFLNQANKAKESGAKTSIGSANRAQQAYRLEHTTFADDFVELGIGQPSVEGYEFEISDADTNTVTNEATPTEDTILQTVTGTVTIDPDAGTTTTTLDTSATAAEEDEEG